LRNILIKAFPSWDDIVQIEPTIEALYYKHYPCVVHLHTFSEYVPFFEHHPLISEIKTGKQDTEGYSDVIELKKEEELSNLVDTVSLFALGAGVRLLRKTPKIFLNTFPKDLDILVQAKVVHRGSSSWPIFDKKLFSKLEPVFIEDPSNSSELRNSLNTLASASAVVGPDSWVTQAAAALDARVVMGIKKGEEALRAPFNTTVVGFSDSSVYRSVQDVLYEKIYPDYMNQGNASEFIKNKAKMYMKSNFIDVGCSRWPLPNGIGVDEHNRDLIENAKDGAFSGVFSSHCLEHIEDWEKELKLWHRVLRKDGYMFLYLPHPRAEVWKAFTGSWVGNNHVWNPEPVTLVQFIKEELNMDIVEYTSRRDSLWSYYIIARKTEHG